MLSIIFGMTPICGSCALTRLLGDAFQTMRLTRSCNFVILPHQVAILAYRGQLARCLTTVSIGPPSSRMCGESIALVSLVREQAVSISPTRDIQQGHYTPHVHTQHNIITVHFQHHQHFISISFSTSTSSYLNGIINSNNIISY